MLIAWAAAAGGVLTKGLVAAAIPAAVLVLYSAIARDWSPWRRLASAPRAAAVPRDQRAVVLAGRAPPARLSRVLFRARALRALSDERRGSRRGVVVLRTGVPRGQFAVDARGLARARDRVATAGCDRRSSMRVVPVDLGRVRLGFFSLSDSKLIPYVLPAMPALALLIGGSPLSVLRRDVLLAAALVLLPASPPRRRELPTAAVDRAVGSQRLFPRAAQPLRRIAAVLAVSALFVLAGATAIRPAAPCFSGVGWCLALLLLMRAAAAVAPIYSGVGLAQALEASRASCRSTASAPMIRPCRSICEEPSRWSPTAASSTTACVTQRPQTRTRGRVRLGRGVSRSLGVGRQRIRHNGY
jgi:4-amino-4-deoxy-L-arabinose transferase-like glycosyltransferase